MLESRQIGCLSTVVARHKDGQYVGECLRFELSGIRSLLYHALIVASMLLEMALTERLQELSDSQAT